MKKIILWWGRFDENYSRNRIIRNAMIRLGYEIRDFKPFLSSFGYVQALFCINFLPSLIWVPCFRHRDLTSAKRWSMKHQIPIIFDPLISSWDKKINERQKYLTSDSKSLKIKKDESKIFKMANLIIADTFAHKTFFSNTFNIKQNKISVIYVGAEESIFYPRINKKNYRKKEILFYGSFLELHGISVIHDAIKKDSSNSINWTLLGDYEKYNPLVKKSNVNYESSIPYHLLPERISKADILLGIFSNSQKANNVIPNKVFQAMACGKPIITRYGDGYPNQIKNNKSGIFFVKANDSDSLLNTIYSLITNDDRLIKAGKASREAYKKYFAEELIENQIKSVLEKFC